MSAPHEAIEPSSTNDVQPPSPRWEFPEIAAVVVLTAVGVLALGGLASGLARGLQDTGARAPIGFDRQLVGYSIVLGALWANVVLAAVLLGLMGVFWWYLGEWEEEPDHGESPRGVAEARGHIARARTIVIGIQLALIVAALAATAYLVGAIMESVGSVVNWSPDFNAGANTLAVLAIASLGVLFGRHLNKRYATVDAAGDHS